MEFVLEGVTIQRKDFELTSIRNTKFQGSLWTPAQIKNYPCLVYLHRSEGNRIDG